MILDERTEFCSAQAVTATAISDVIDLGATPTLRDIGNGHGAYLVIQCDESATASGSATVAFSLESDSTANLATSPTVHLTTAAIGKATLVAGYRVLCIALPIGVNYERYLGVRFTVATGPLTAGKFSAFITMDPTGSHAYPNAVGA
jgi:hypothetical protein